MQDFDFHKVTFLFWCFTGHNAFFCWVQSTKLHFFLMFRWSQCILLLSPVHKVTLLFDVSLVTMHSSESSCWIVISFFVDHCDNGTCVLYCKHVCCRDRRWGAFFSPSPCVTWFYHWLPGGACRFIFSPCLKWNFSWLLDLPTPPTCAPPPPPPPPHTHTHSLSLSLHGHYRSHHRFTHAYCPVPVSSPL